MKKGFLIAEATIFLPVFLIGIMTLACLLPMLAVQERVMNAFVNSAEQVSKAAYLTRVEVIPSQFAGAVAGGALSRLYLSEEVEKITLSEAEKPVEDLKINEFLYLYHFGGRDGLIRAGMIYRYRIPFPIRFYGDLEFKELLVFRGFIGSSLSGEAYGFDRMEEDSHGNQVFIFPRSGERYHKEECSTIAVYPRQVILTKALRRAYEPCRICSPGALPDGSLVYCFPRAGEVFHRGACTTVEKYVVEVEREQAEKDGYTPCRVCGG